MAVREHTHTHAHDEAAHDDEMTADDIEGTYVPRIRPEVDGVEVDGEAVLVIQGVWSLHWLNPISTVVFNEFDGVSTIDDVAARLSRAFKADPEVVRNDVLDMTRQLARDGFLEGIEAEAPKTVAAGFEGVPVGTAVPPVELPDLTGTTKTLEDFKGQQVFLVNWSLSCGFCTRIAPEIAELQPKLRARGIKTVFISTGAREGLQDQQEEFNLDVPVLVQETQVAEIFFGMGTPSAYLLDENGMTASELSFGAEAVPALLRGLAGVSSKGNGSTKSTRAKTSTRSKSSAKSKGAARSKTATRSKSSARSTKSTRSKSAPKRRAAAKK